MPELVAQIGGGDRTEVVWKNQVGGLTFEVGTAGDRRFVKWVATPFAHEFAAEVERLQRTQHHTPVPTVLDLRNDEQGAALVTSPVPGRSAVHERWLDSPATAVKAIGEGLRALHDRLPVEGCPFSWSAADRITEARLRLERGELDPIDWQPEHRHLSTTDAIARIADAPPIDRLVVCHGDACAPNTLIDDNGRWSGHVDLGALGVADRWADLAVATWSTRWNYGPGWESLLLDAYGIDNNPDLHAYYRLLWDLSS